MRKTLAALFAAVMLAACVYQPGYSSNPLARKFSWYSYLNGDDLRSACVPGAPDRYRFVYNGVYVEQVRMYEVSDPGDGGGPLLTARVVGEANVAEVDTSDLLAPWRGKAERLRLRPGDIDLLGRTMESAGVFDGAPDGMRMESEDFYWIVGACRAGQFFFNAYRWPSERFAKAEFAKLLFAWDPTGVEVNRPRKVYLMNIYGSTQTDSTYHFQIRVDGNGLLGVPRFM